MSYAARLFITLCLVFHLNTTAQSPGNSLHFDGTNDLITATLPPVFNNIAVNDFTMEAWVKPQGAVFCRIIFAQFASNNVATFSLGTSNQVYFYVVVNGTTFSSVTTTTLPLNTWSHVACQWNASVSSPGIFINGVQQAVSGGGGTSVGSLSNVTVGSRPGGFQYFIGELDEVRIWNTARTVCQVNGTKNSELMGNEAGLVLYYNLNHGVAGGSNPSVTTATDLTPNAFHGTLANFALTGAASNWLASGATITHTGPSVITNSDSIRICDGDTLLWDTLAITAAGTYSVSFTTAGGCDSIVSMKVEVSPVYSGTLNDVICAGQEYAFGEMSLNAPGVYLGEFLNAGGCDSLVTLTLTNFVVDTSVSANGRTLQANLAGAAYQWLDCGNGFAPVAGETNRSFTPSADGSFAVRISDQMCSDTSGCRQVSDVGISSAVNGLSIRIHPNPADEVFTLECTGSGSNEAVVSITDRTGRMMCSFTATEVDEVIETTMDVSEYPSGIYLVTIQTGMARHTKRLMIR